MLVDYNDLAIAMMTAAQSLLTPMIGDQYKEGNQWAHDVEICLSNIAKGHETVDEAFQKLIKKYSLKTKVGLAELRIVTLNGATRNAAALIGVFNGIVVFAYHYQTRSWSGDDQFVGINSADTRLSVLPAHEMQWENVWTNIMHQID